MIQKFFKEIDFNKINRDISALKKYLSNVKYLGKRYYNDDVAAGKCRICNSTKIKKYVKINELYDYYICENCKAVVLGNLPRIKDMYMGDDEKAINIYVDEDVYYTRVDMITKPKIDFALENILNVNKWLDIGCGTGEVLFYLKKNDLIEATGIESDNREIEFARGKGLKIYNGFVDPKSRSGDIEKIIHDNDVISFFNVIEHIENPTEFIEYIYESSNEDSYIVFDTPKHPSLASFVNYMYNDQVHRHMGPPVHLQIFSIESIQYMFEGKYEIIATWEYGQGFTDLLNNAMLATETKEDQLYFDLIRISNQVEKVIDENRLGDQILVIAKKI